jgi:type II secretory pathway pseudopilin PulG
MALSDPPPRGRARLPKGGKLSDDGSTLIEVVAAMVILAVGLLALQALALAAVHGLGLAKRNTWAVTTASRYLEESLDQLRQDVLPAPFSCTLASGDEIARAVIDTGDPALIEVRVEVRSESRGASPRPFALSAHVYSPRGFTPAPDPFPCP